jgi:predicted phage tail protein
MDNSNTEAGFRIERRTLVDPAFVAVATAGPDITTFQDAVAADGMLSQYRVIAFSAAGDSLPSNNATVITPLAPPTNLSAALSPAPPLAVILNWTDNSGAELGYTIQRARNAAFTQGLTTFTVAANVTTFTNGNAGLAANVTYYYRIRALSLVSSAWSPTAIISTAVPARPTTLAITSRTRTSVSLSWLDNSSNEASFVVQRSTSSTFTANLVSFTLPANSTSFVVDGLNPNTRYYFRVRAVNGAGLSTFSNTVNTFTLP